LLRFLKSNKGLVYIIIGNIVGAILTGGFWLLLASLQSVEEYGKTSYMISMASLASSFALLGLNTAITTFIPKGHEKIHVAANQVVLISSIIAALIVAQRDWLLGFFVVGMSFWMMSIYEFLGRKSYKQYAIANIGARGCQLLLSIVLYYLIGIPGIIIGFTISFFLFSHRYIHSIKYFNRDFSEISGKMKFALHSYSFNMSNALLMYFDKIIIPPIFGYAILGYYQLGFQFLMFLGMIPISFFQYLIPEESSGNKKTKLRIIGFGLSIGLAVLLFFLSPIIINIFFPHYQNSLDAIRVISIGIIPMMVAYVINSKFLSEGNTRGVVIGAIIYQILQITLMILLGRLIEVTGIALSVVIALTGQALFLLLYKKHSKRRSTDK
jgi:O-antigen/teichoic acid export membrane protein